MTDQTDVRPDAPADRSWWQAFRCWPGWARASAYVAVGAGARPGRGPGDRRRRWSAGRSRRPTGELELPGLTGEVTVVRDEHGIPQLYGDSLDDLMRAQGFVHAQERFFEMDVRRHVTAGRLAELFGEDALETDKFIRTHGLAPGRRAGAGAARAGDPRRPGGLRRRRQRLPRRPLARASSASSTPCSAPAASTTGPSRGRRSTRWPGSRRWRGTCAAT